MAELSCLECGDELETWGVYGNVIPTLFCGNCCASFKQAADDHSPVAHTVCKARALTYYGCTKSDLKSLNSGWVKKIRNDTTQLYLTREVDYLGHQRNIQRKNQLEAQLGIKLRTIDPVLRMRLLGDYLQRSNQRRTTLNEVQQRFKVLDRVKAIRSNVRHADPSAAFDFAIRYPEGSPEEFSDLRERCHQAFRISGDRIMSRLSKKDHWILLQTPLKEVVREYWNRQKQQETVK